MCSLAANAFLSMPSCKVLVIINALLFAGALALYALAVVAHRRARMRRLAGDPYAAPFGDVTPAPRDHMRAYMGPRS